MPTAGFPKVTLLFFQVCLYISVCSCSKARAISTTIQSPENREFLQSDDDHSFQVVHTEPPLNSKLDNDSAERHNLLPKLNPNSATEINVYVSVVTNEVNSVDLETKQFNFDGAVQFNIDQTVSMNITDELFFDPILMNSNKFFSIRKLQGSLFRYTGPAFMPVDTARFPFGKQSLELHISGVPKPNQPWPVFKFNTSGSYTNGDIHIPGWLSYFSEPWEAKTQQAGSIYGRQQILKLSTEIHMSPMKAIIRYILPPMFILLTALVSFSIPFEDGATRLGLCGSALVTLVLFHQGQTEIHVGSTLTVIDQYLGLCYSVILIATFLHAVILKLIGFGHKRIAQRLALNVEWAGWLMSPLTFTVLVTEWWVTLLSMIMLPMIYLLLKSPLASGLNRLKIWLNYRVEYARRLHDDDDDEELEDLSKNQSLRNSDRFESNELEAVVRQQAMKDSFKNDKLSSLDGENEEASAQTNVSPPLTAQFCPSDVESDREGPMGDIDWDEVENDMLEGKRGNGGEDSSSESDSGEEFFSARRANAGRHISSRNTRSSPFRGAGISMSRGTTSRMVTRPLAQM